jgi:hypothetical protein
MLPNQSRPTEQQQKQQPPKTLSWRKRTSPAPGSTVFSLDKIREVETEFRRPRKTRKKPRFLQILPNQSLPTEEQQQQQPPKTLSLGKKNKASTRIRSFLFAKNPRDRNRISDVTEKNQQFYQMLPKSISSDSTRRQQ